MDNDKYKEYSDYQKTMELMIKRKKRKEQYEAYLNSQKLNLAANQIKLPAKED